MNTTACTPPSDSTQRACLQWYQIDPRDPNSFTIQQQALVQLAGYHFFAPGIAANNQGHAVLAYNVSGTDHYAGMNFSGRYHTDPLKTLQPSFQQVKSGEGCYERANGQNTVSLNSEVTVDPIDDSMFWLTSGYVYGKDASCQKND